MAVALKEANETEYWIELLGQSGYMEEKVANSLKNSVKYFSRKKHPVKECFGKIEQIICGKFPQLTIFHVSNFLLQYSKQVWDT